LGQKFLGTPGKWIPITDEECHKVMGTTKPVAQSPLAMGKVVRYTTNGATKVGKISGINKAGLLLIAPICGQSKAGYQFSTEQDQVAKSDIIGQVQTTL